MNVIKNIIEIRKNKGFNQERLADALNVDVSAISNIEKGKRELRVNELEKIAKSLEVNVIDLFAYPDEYEKKGIREEITEVLLQIKLNSDKKDQVLKLVLGDKNLEIK